MPEERVVAFQSFVFRRADGDTVWEDDPMSPVGGSFYNPTPTNAFWSRIPLPGDKPLFVSMRIFTSDGAYPQEADWSPPVLFVKHGDQGIKGADGIGGSNGVNGFNGATGNDGIAGQNGEVGDTGISISWAGNATAHPTEPVEGLSYYNTVDKVTYVYWGGFWYIMGKDGIDLTLDLTPPAILTNLVATSYYAQIGLSWDQPTDPLHAYTEIYRNIIDDRETAEFIAGSMANQYMDIPENKLTSITYYYWAKAVSISFIKSDWNAVAGVPGTTADDPTYMLELLVGRLGYGQFDVANGVFPIRTIETLPAIPDIQNYPIDSRLFLTSDRLIYKNVGNVWTVEPDQAAIRAEFGVGVLTAGAVLAESIGTNEIIALNANIKDGVIENAKLKDLTVDSAKIANGAIIDAKISGIIKSSALAADGQPQWSINKDGGIDARNLVLRDSDGTIILASGANLNHARVAGLGGFATLSQITTANISTYIASLAIGTLQIANSAVTESITTDTGNTAYGYLRSNWYLVSGPGLNVFSIPVADCTIYIPSSGVPVLLLFQLDGFISQDVNGASAPYPVQFKIINQTTGVTLSGPFTWESLNGGESCVTNLSGHTPPWDSGYNFTWSAITREKSPSFMTSVRDAGTVAGNNTFIIIACINTAYAHLAFGRRMLTAFGFKK